MPTKDEKRETARNKSKSVVNKQGKNLSRSGTVRLGKNEGMVEGKSGARGYNVGNKVNKRDINEMKAQGFTDKKIAKVIGSQKKEVGKRAQSWMTAQANKQQEGGTQSPPNQNQPGQSTQQPPESPEPQNTPVTDPTDAESQATAPSPAPSAPGTTTTPAATTEAKASPVSTTNPDDFASDDWKTIENDKDHSSDDWKNEDTITKDHDWRYESNQDLLNDIGTVTSSSQPPATGTGVRQGDTDIRYDAGDYTDMSTTDNSREYSYDAGQNNTAAGGQGGTGNTNLKDTGDLSQKSDQSSANTLDNSGDIANQIGDVSGGTINQDFSRRAYHGDTKNFTYISGNTGAGGGPETDMVGTMATLGEYYAPSDSPASRASFVDQYTDLNNQNQKTYDQQMSGTAQTAIDQASNNAYIDPAKMDNRIAAREKANYARSNVMGSQMFGDLNNMQLNWEQPDAAEDPEKPDFNDMYNTYSNF